MFSSFLMTLKRLWELREPAEIMIIPRGPVITTEIFHNTSTRGAWTRPFGSAWYTNESFLTAIQEVTCLMWRKENIQKQPWPSSLWFDMWALCGDGAVRKGWSKAGTCSGKPTNPTRPLCAHGTAAGPHEGGKVTLTAHYRAFRVGWETALCVLKENEGHTTHTSTG